MLLARWAARIFGFLVSLFFLVMIVGETIMTIQDEQASGFNPESLYVIIPVILAVSRPTELAVALASKLKMTLACLSKQSGLHIFSAGHRLLPDSSTDRPV